MLLYELLSAVQRISQLSLHLNQPEPPTQALTYTHSTCLYFNADVMMGVSAWIVWSNGGWSQNKFSLGVWIVQLLLNLAWVSTSGYNATLHIGETAGPAACQFGGKLWSDIGDCTELLIYVVTDDS